jgi:hypothetical protein
MRCERIGPLVASGPNRFVGSSRKCGDIVLATGLFIRIVHLSVGGMQC